MIYLFVVYGLVAGYFAGFLGIGVGAFLMPFFVLVGMPYREAIAASLMAVFLSSLIGGIQYYREKSLEYEPCICISVTGVICAAVGGFIVINLVSASLLMILFAALLFLNADFFRFFKNKNVEFMDAKSINHKRYFPLYITLGIIVGFSASLMGIGGGIIIVPILMRVTRMPAKDAVRIAVVAMIFTTCSGMLPYIIDNTMPYHVALGAEIGAIIGSFFGTIALKYVKQTFIAHVNYIISLVLGFIMLFRAIV